MAAEPCGQDAGVGGLRSVSEDGGERRLIAGRAREGCGERRCAVAQPTIVEGSAGDVESRALGESLAGPEKAIIRAALEANGWNRQNTAAALQINRTTLYKKMKRYGLEDEAARLGL